MQKKEKSDKFVAPDLIRNFYAIVRTYIEHVTDYS